MPSRQPSSVASLDYTSFTMPAEILRPTISKTNTPHLTSQARSKFLMRIGVVGTDPIACKHLEVADCVADSRIHHTRDLLQNVPRYTTQLRYNRQDERKHMERRKQRSAAASANTNSSSSESSPEKSKPKRCITFDESVNVVPIPMRHEYSDRIRSRLWSNTVELYENAGRSCKLTLHQSCTTFIVSNQYLLPFLFVYILQLEITLSLQQKVLTGVMLVTTNRCKF